MKLCPCCSNIPYGDCCGRFLDNHKLPGTPEALMRSRYTAYAMDNLDYIEKTMKSPALDNFDKQSSSQIKWLKLAVIQTKQQGTMGKVEYIAYYEINGETQQIHEKAKFSLEDGKWYYVDGKLLDSQLPPKIGRNSPCTCGSGKKFKKCCQNKSNCRCDPHITGHVH